jgi:hypothetical protein
MAYGVCFVDPIYGAIGYQLYANLARLASESFEQPAFRVFQQTARSAPAAHTGMPDAGAQADDIQVFTFSRHLDIALCFVDSNFYIG